jgi:hypothetical protein
MPNGSRVPSKRDWQGSTASLGCCCPPTILRSCHASGGPLQHRALGRKVSDEFTVPLCRGHHREVHRCGDEAAWWQKAGVDPAASARALWLQTHPLPSTPAAEKTLEDAGTRDAASADPSVSNAHRPIASGGLNDKTNPIVPAPSR